MVLVLACSAPDAVVVVTVQAGTATPGTTHLRLALSNGGFAETRVFPEATDAAAGVVSFPATLALIVPHSRRGALDVAVEALNASGAVLGHGAGTTTIAGGRRSELTITLTAGASPCGGHQIDSGATCDDGNRQAGDRSDAGLPTRGPQDAPSTLLDAAQPDAAATDLSATGSTLDLSRPMDVTPSADVVVVSTVDASAGLDRVVLPPPIDQAPPDDGPSAVDLGFYPDAASPTPDLAALPDLNNDASKANGVMCTTGVECSSGHCEQGVCCGSACSLTCYSCNLAGLVGTCALVPAGNDPLLQCPDQASSTCGTTGLCNGAGACATWSQGTSCAPPSCTNGNASAASTCSSAGMCVAPTSTWCVTYACDGASTTCKTSCGNDNDCLAPAKCVNSKCGGLKGDYWDGSDFSGSPAFTRVDAQVDFTWAAPDSPNVTLLGPDTFTVRWTGKVVPRFSETYTFITYSDDGVRLWVNGSQLVNNWNNHGVTRNTGTIALQAGTAYDLTMEYFQGANNGTARLLWSSASEAEQVIPQIRLIPGP